MAFYVFTLHLSLMVQGAIAFVYPQHEINQFSICLAWA